MTSSYANIIGTPRDQIPDISDTNWENTSPDLSKAANAEITDNQAELKEFLGDLGQIEKQIADDSFEVIAGLDKFLRTGVEFKRVRDADKESRETLKRFRELDETAKAKLNELEDLSELTELELEAELKKLAIDETTGKVDEVALEYLKLKYFKTGEEVDFDGVKGVYDKHAGSAFNTNIEDNFIYSAATEAQANSIADRATTNILTKFYKDLKLKGIDINSREVQSYVNRHLLPELAKQQAQAISTYKQTTLKRYYQGVERKKDNIIAEGLGSKSVIEHSDGRKEVVHNGNIDNVLLKIQKIDGVNKQEALQILLDRLPQLKNQLSSGGIQYLLNDAKIEHSSGVTITGLDSELAYKLIKGNDGNVIQLKRLLSDVQQTTEAVRKRVHGNYETWFRENTALNNGVHLIDTENGKNKVMQKVDEYIRDMKASGVDVEDIQIPGFFFGDESTDSNVDFSAKANTFKDINNQSWETDWQSKLDEGGELPLEGTRDIQILKAKQYLYTQLELAKATNPSLDVAGWMHENYPKVISKLVKGDFEPDENDILILPTAERLEIEVDTFKKNPEKWLNNTKVNSIEEKQGILEGIKWRDNNFQGPMPGYLKVVGEANDMTGLEYLETRLKAMNMWNEKDENFQNPEDALKLSKEELKTLTIRPNFTKNHLILNPTDEDRTTEAKVLTILRKTTPGRKVDHVGVKTGTFKGADMLLDWLTPGTEIRTVGRMYEMAKSGNFDDFGIYGLSAEELIQAVDSGVVDMNDDFDENTQDFLALNLIRVKANQQTSIQGAVTEGYDWRRLINLNRAEKAAVLKFFPNLRGMSINQFQDLQPDISLAILNDVEKKFQTVKTGDAITSKEQGLFTRAYIQANPEFSFLNKGLSEENINAELEDNTAGIVNQILKAGTFVGKEHEERLITIRIFFENRIKEGKPVPEDIRRALYGTRNMYQRGSWKFGLGNELKYTDNFDYLNYSPQNTEEKK